MGENGCGFGLDFIKKKFKKEIKRKLTMKVPNFLYTNSILLLDTKKNQTQSFTFIEIFFFGLFSLK